MREERKKCGKKGRRNADEGGEEEVQKEGKVKRR
uniref:Uncharacterized protein n=1 Tax=Anguilla anguilla TaxID=7936 RepID=A0A0E9T228_ANGAN